MTQKILVVEDQEAVRAVACGFLQDFGYDIVEAEDGLQALARLQENPDIDLMFSDVVMPGGLNGFDLAQAARGIRPDLKVVHTSGYPKGAMVHQEEPRFREGFIIMKPYRREDLQKIIRDALELQTLRRIRGAPPRAFNARCVCKGRVWRYECATGVSFWGERT